MLNVYAFLFVVIEEMEQEHEQAQTSSTKTQAQIRIEKSQVVYEITDRSMLTRHKRIDMSFCCLKLLRKNKIYRVLVISV